MKPSFFGLIHFGLLRGASLLVPGIQRAEWRREWNSELWHVRHSCRLMEGASWRAEREVASFCLGAFQDAFCLILEVFLQHLEPYVAPSHLLRCYQG